MKSLIVILGVALGLSAAYAVHDVTCWAVINPDDSYVQADSAIIPKLSIVNLGDKGEASFWVRLVVINGFRGYGDTVYVDSALVDHLHPYPDSLEVELPEWIPEDICKDYASEEDGPFVQYELYGVAVLEGDENPGNDTAFWQVTCLWAHDVGVIGLEWPEAPDSPPDHYNTGSTITATARVENFGYNAETNVQVHLVVYDAESTGVKLWSTIQNIAFLDWRGNTLNNPFVVDVAFPPYTVVNDHHQYLGAYTELEGDQCTKDDSTIRYPIRPMIREVRILPSSYSLDAVDGVIIYEVPRAGKLKMNMFDANGRRVACLADDICQAGTHEIIWNEQDDKGSLVPSGVYFVHMDAGGYRQVRRLVVVR